MTEIDQTTIPSTKVMPDFIEPYYFGHGPLAPRARSIPRHDTERQASVGCMAKLATPYKSKLNTNLSLVPQCTTFGCLIRWQTESRHRDSYNDL